MNAEVIASLDNLPRIANRNVRIDNEYGYVSMLQQVKKSDGGPSPKVVLMIHTY